MFPLGSVPAHTERAIHIFQDTQMAHFWFKYFLPPSILILMPWITVYGCTWRHGSERRKWMKLYCKDMLIFQEPSQPITSNLNMDKLKIQFTFNFIWPISIISLKKSSQGSCLLSFLTMNVLHINWLTLYINFGVMIRRKYHETHSSSDSLSDQSTKRS